MQKQKLFVEIPNFKLDAIRRLVIFALSFMLIFVFVYNINTFVRAWNIYNYDKYLDKLYAIKKKDGVQALVKINNSCIAYFECEELGIHLPILEVDSKAEEDFYLNHDFRKVKNELGSPYQKYGTKLNQTTITTFVGHSAYTGSLFNIQKSRAIFGRFNNYIYENDYNYRITVETLDDIYNYQVVSVMKFNSKNTSGLDELSVYNTINIDTQSRFDNFLNIIKTKSWVNIPEIDDVSFGDKFISIFTCATDNLDYRIMVIAKLV